MKTDSTRFPRCHHRPGVNTTQLTALSDENCRADVRAFAAVMSHLRQVDGRRHTVLMMQVENEAGVRPVLRDHCPLAEAAFARAAPAELMNYLAAHKDTLVNELKDIWTKTKFRETGTWSEIFGNDADEVFSAWTIGGYVGRVAAAGKAEYPLPMYANAWLVQSKGQKAGEYPSGGPVAKMMDVCAPPPRRSTCWRRTFTATISRPCVPSTRRTATRCSSPRHNATITPACALFYAVGQHHALGFSPFGIDSLTETNVLRNYYCVLRNLRR